MFESASLFLSLANAVWIMLDADYNSADFLLDAEPVFQVVEHLFCVLFLAEWAVRFMALKRKSDGRKDMWFVFDTVMLFIMILETWVMTLAIALSSGNHSSLGDASVLRILRVLRVTKAARLVRLVRAMPELIVLLKGIAVATRSVFFTFLLTLMIIYIFAILFRQLCKGTPLEQEHFPSVPDSMAMLLLSGFFPDLTSTVYAFGDESLLLACLFVFCIFMIAITVMNLLIGVLVEVVSVVAALEKEQLDVKFVKASLAQMMPEVDHNEDRHISRLEFEDLMHRPEFNQVLQSVGIDVVGLLDLTDFIFKDGHCFSHYDFMELVLQLRGSNKSTVKDIVDLRKFLVQELVHMQTGIEVALKQELRRQHPACGGPSTCGGGLAT